MCVYVENEKKEGKEIFVDRKFFCSSFFLILFNLITAKSKLIFSFFFFVFKENTAMNN